MRLFKLLRYSLLTAAFFVTSAAGAVEFSHLGATSVTINAGESFQIELALDNNSASTVFGVTGILDGMAAAGASVTSGQSASAHFVAVCLAPPTGCLGGPLTVDNAFYNPNDLSASGEYSAGDDSIVIVNALATAPSVNTGAADPGLIGGDLVPSSLDVTLTLIANIVGVHVLTIGGTFSDGTNVIPITEGTTFTVTVIPEPGTAILMGLGLAGLASAGRRRE
jgi:hypothetical protein